MLESGGVRGKARFIRGIDTVRKIVIDGVGSISKSVGRYSVRYKT